MFFFMNGTIMERPPVVKKNIPTWSPFPTDLLPGLLYLDHTCSRCITRKRWRVREIEVTSCRFRSVSIYIYVYVYYMYIYIYICIYVYLSTDFYSSTHVSPTFLWHGNVLKGHHLLTRWIYGEAPARLRCSPFGQSLLMCPGILKNRRQKPGESCWHQTSKQNQQETSIEIVDFSH